MKKILAFCLLLFIGSFAHGGSSPPQPILPEISPGFLSDQNADCFAQALPVVTPYVIGLAVFNSEVYPVNVPPGNHIHSSTSEVNIQTAFVQNPLKSDIGTNKIKPSNGRNQLYSLLPTLYNCPLPAT